MVFLLGHLFEEMVFFLMLSLVSLRRLSVMHTAELCGTEMLSKFRIMFQPPFSLQLGNVYTVLGRNYIPQPTSDGISDICRDYVVYWDWEVTVSFFLPVQVVHRGTKQCQFYCRNRLSVIIIRIPRSVSFCTQVLFGHEWCNIWWTLRKALFTSSETDIAW